jgi:hypothetical protein
MQQQLEVPLTNRRPMAASFRPLANPDRRRDRRVARRFREFDALDDG